MAKEKVRKVEDMTEAERLTTASALISEILNTYKVQLNHTLGVVAESPKET